MPAQQVLMTTIHHLPLNTDELERIRDLRRYEILDTPREEPFESIVWLAAKIFKQPIAFVSFVDGQRQWFKASIGLQVSATPRQCSFGAQTILGSDVFVVSDASKDCRFRDSPHVIHSPHIHFYAGAPLTTPNGYNVGSVGVASRHPGYMDRAGREILLRLAKLTMDELELRLSTDRVASRAARAAANQAELDHARADLATARRALCVHGAETMFPGPSPGSFIRSLL